MDRKTKQVLDMQQFRAREELKLGLLKFIRDFKSKEEPDYGDLTNSDIIYALSTIITRKTS